MLDEAELRGGEAVGGEGRVLMDAPQTDRKGSPRGGVMAGETSDGLAEVGIALIALLCLRVVARPFLFAASVHL